MKKFFMLMVVAGLAIAFCLSSFFGSVNLVRSSAAAAVDRESHLLQIGRPPKTQSSFSASPNLKVVSYNIRYRSGEDLKQLAQLLKEDPEIGGATILGLQEVDRNKKRSGNKNTAAILAEELGMHYAWAAPPATGAETEEETGVAILSAYPLSDVCRLVLPHKGPGGKQRVAIGATIKLERNNLRFYSVHSETRMKVDRKLEQMKAVIDDLARYDKKMPAIILGDLNTWEPAAISRTFKLFTAEGFQTPFPNDPTFLRRILFVPIKLKLDWMWLRNLEATGNGIDRTIKLSDHFPLWVTLRTVEAKSDAAAAAIK